MTELSNQSQIIYDILKDGNWHCPQEWGYADGHTKRITDINDYLRPLNQKIASDWCDCGKHTSKIKKRKIVPIEPIVAELRVKAWADSFKQSKTEKIKQLTLL